MEKITYPSNTVRQHIRNALSSKLFCAVAIVSAIFSASLALNLVTSMLYAGLTQHYEFSGKFVFPILAIIGTVGLFTVRSAAKSNDSARLISGIKMSKCYIAIKVIYVILFYIVSLSAIVIGSMLAFFDAALDGFVVYDNIFDIIDRYLKQLNLDGTPVVVFGVALILVGMFLLAIAILGGIYRKGISKAVKCAVKAKTSDRTEIRISSFSIGFGYVIGVLLMLNSLTFTGTDLLKLPFAYDPDHRAFAIYLISFAVSKLAYFAFGLQIFLFSLFLSRAKFQLSKVISGAATNGMTEGAHCNHCGAAIPVGSAFCNSCGSRVGSSVQETAVKPEQPAATETFSSAPEDKPEEQSKTEEKNPEAKPDSADTVFCTSCGMPMPANQPFCTNCGNKLH